MSNFSSAVQRKRERQFSSSISKQGHDDAGLAEATSFTERLRQAIGEKSLRQFALKCNISSSALRQYFNGKSEPTRPVLMRIANAAGVGIEWLVTGQGTMRLNDGSDGQSSHFLANNASCGVLKCGDDDFEVSSDQISDDLMFKREWVAREIGADPANLLLVCAPDDSMEPTIRQGDAALVDMSRNQVSNDAVYAILVNDRIVIKRIQLMVFESVHMQIISDNPAYKTHIMKGGAADSLKIVGRVVWTGRKC